MIDPIRVLFKPISAFLMALIMVSCLSSSNLIDLPRSAKIYDFKILGESYAIKSKGGKWSSDTLYEYFIRSSTTSDSVLVRNISGALLAFSYKPKLIDYRECVVLAKRGIKPNEWKAIVGVYFKINEDTSEIYIRVQISQDITGGFREERAQQLGELICRTLGTCKASYDISTQSR